MNEDNLLSNLLDGQVFKRHGKSSFGSGLFVTCETSKWSSKLCVQKERDGARERERERERERDSTPNAKFTFLRFPSLEISKYVSSRHAIGLSLLILFENLSNCFPQLTYHKLFEEPV